jgi:Uma2 family endonuclease
MVAARHPILTEEEFLALERKSEIRHEYFRGVAYAMAGALEPHNAIKSNFEIRVGIQLVDGPCRTYSSDQMIRTDGGLYAYPDIIIVCGEPQFHDHTRETITNPLVLIEILSKSTAAYDRGLKFEQYKSIPSLMEYLLISQERLYIEHYTRQPSGNWGKLEYFDSETVIHLATIGCTLKVGDVYRGVAV